LIVVKPGNFPGLTTIRYNWRPSLLGRSRWPPRATQSVRGRLRTGTLHRLARSDILWVARPDAPASPFGAMACTFQTVSDCASLSPFPVRGQPRTVYLGLAFTLGVLLFSYRSATFTGRYPEGFASGIARSTCCLRRAPGVLSYGQGWECPRVDQKTVH